mgnify:CR=1 FL=1
MTSWNDSPNPAQRATRRLIAARPVTWLLARTMHHLDGAALRLSGGRMPLSPLFTGLPTITLTTTGAKSGRPRTVPLVGIPDGDRLILIASNWGQARHPAWLYNIRANPVVRVSGRGVPLERLPTGEDVPAERLPTGEDVPAERLYVARELAGDERAAAWARAVALYPGYQGYAARAGREIAVVALESEDVEG